MPLSATRRAASSAFALVVMLGGLATAGPAQQPEPVPTSRRAAAADAKVAQDADWGIVRSEPASLKFARTAPNALLAGIKLTSVEWTNVNAIKRQYTLDLNEMGRDRRTADGASEPDNHFAARIDARRQRLRGDVRDALSPAKQDRMDLRVFRTIR